MLDFLLVVLYVVEQFLLALPLAAELLFLLLQVGNFLVQLFQLGLVVLALDGFALDFQLFQLTRDFVEFLGHRVALHSQLGSGFVHEVDGLVGQETVGDVAVRKGYGGDDGIVLDTNLVVVFVAFLQSAQDADGRGHVGLVDHHALESAFQRLVLFKVFLVLVEGGGAD